MTEIPMRIQCSSTSFPQKFLPHIYHHRLPLEIKETKILQRKMIPQQWTPPCGNQCTHKYAALMQIPWRVFCKKGCNADGDTWEECLSECDEICYKDPVLKDQQWSAYIDRSPGSATYSQDCFHACVSGCGYKFEIPSEKVTEVHPNRPTPPPPPPAAKTNPPPPPPPKSGRITEDVPSTSA